MGNNFNGIVNVYKETGFTSFDVVAKLRGIFGQRKIGHTGTLDPDATGVLPICLGNATKVVELLMDYDKEYIAELLLGMATDTQDISGEAISVSGPDLCEDLITEEMLRDIIGSFVGESEQIPPMYSALKVNGKKLCDLARQGVSVERKARKITIHEIEILDFSQCSPENLPEYVSDDVKERIGNRRLPLVKMRVHCSKGTYIRTLCDDIGKKAGCGGTMYSLERSRVGIFTKEDALTLEKIQELKDSDRLSEIVSPVDGLFPEYPKLTVSEDSLKKLENGNVLESSDYVNQNAVKEHACVRVYRPDGSFAGIYKRDERGNTYHPEKMFL